MKISKILIPIVALIALCSCLIDKYVSYHVPGYVSDYYFLQERNDINVNDSNVENGTLSIKLPMNQSHHVDVTNYGKKKKKAEYYSLCQKFDDMYYNQSVDQGHDISCNYVHAIADVITDIKIVGDDDWNTSYPKGTLLNDLFSIKCKTIYPYIKSRYTSEPVVTAIDKPLPDIVESDLTLLQYEVYSHWVESHGWIDTGSCFLELYTDKLPANPIQTLHITLTTDEGKKLEYTVELDLK